MRYQSEFKLEGQLLPQLVAMIYKRIAIIDDKELVDFLRYN